MQTQTRRRTQTRWPGATLGVAALLLAAGGAGAKTPHKGQAVTDAKTLTLSGQIGGTWAPRPAANGEAGYDLSGNGALGPLGPVRVAGRLPAPGTHGPGGTLTLTAPDGTLTLALPGGVTPSPASPFGAAAPPATPVAFTVTGGTGAYAGEHGAGTALLVMTPQRRPAVVPGRRTPHFIVAAMFSLTFGAPAPAQAAPRPPSGTTTP